LRTVGSPSRCGAFRFREETATYFLSRDVSINRTSAGGDVVLEETSVRKQLVSQPVSLLASPSEVGARSGAQPSLARLFCSCSPVRTAKPSTGNAPPAVRALFLRESNGTTGSDAML
jgi:hypothetical protein